MSALKIHRDHEGGRWVVMRLGDFARVLASFESLSDAESYVLEHGDPIPEVQT